MEFDKKRLKLKKNDQINSDKINRLKHNQNNVYREEGKK